MIFKNVRGAIVTDYTLYSGPRVWRRASYPENDGGPLTCTYTRDGECPAPATHLVTRGAYESQWQVTTEGDRLGGWDDLLDEQNRNPPRYQRREFCATHAAKVAAERNRHLLTSVG